MNNSSSSISFDAFQDVLRQFEASTSSPSSGLMGGAANNVERNYVLNERRILAHHIPNYYIDMMLGEESLLYKVIDNPVDEMFKYLPDIKGLPKRIEKKLIQEYNIGWKEAFEFAQRLANKYGTAYIELKIRDGKSPSSPIDPSQSYIIDGYEIYTHEEVTVGEGTYSLYKAPRLWRITPNLANDPLTGNTREGSYLIHRSRLLIFAGQKVIGQEYRTRNYRHKPNWFGCFQAYQNYQLGLSAALNMLQDYDIFIYKMKGLYEIIEMQRHNPECDQQLLSRIKALVDGKSITRSMIIDAEIEEGEFINREYDGVNEIIDDLRRAFAEKTDIPVSMLFESSQGNLFGSDSGLSDRYLYSSTINKKQRKQIEPNLRQLFGILETKTRRLSYEFYFRPTIEMTAHEEAKLLFDVSKSAASDVVSKILTPQQAARRYADSHFKTYIQLSEEEINKAPNTYDVVGQNGASAGTNSANQAKNSSSVLPDKRINGQNAKSLGSN